MIRYQKCIILKNTDALKGLLADVELMDFEGKTELVITIPFQKGYGRTKYNRLTKE